MHHKILHIIPSKYKFWRYPLFFKIKYRLITIFSRQSICIKYWINAPVFLWTTSIKNYNWGDYINQPLAELISGRRVIPHRFYAKPSVAMVGSILPWAITSDTIIWGSGCLDSHDTGWNHVEKPQKVSAVRGPLTRKVLLEHGIDCPEVYGDPALLFPRYYSPTPRQTRYKVGIILHVSSDYTSLPDFSYLSDSILIINPAKFGKWQDFIDDILSCDMILSSSLHGLIIADAYCVPNLWIALTNSEHPDDNFKFKDYYFSTNRDVTNPVVLERLTPIELQKCHNNWIEPRIDLDGLLNSCPFFEK